MPALLSNVDPDGLLEYSVVYTDRSLNHMSKKFGGVMRDISGILKAAYQAHAVAIVPGSGSFGMEAVARQFATGQRVLVIRNGWFSYRWSQIFEMGHIPSQPTVLRAAPTGPGATAPYAPPPLDEVLATIAREKPAVVFAPHVETSAGMILPDSYLKAVADATHAVGGLFVLDCIASGCAWVDMQATGVDLLVSAPQKGWSGPPCAGFVMFSERAHRAIEGTTSSSFAIDLKKWLQIMATYESGAHAYHATMPTESMVVARNVMAETRDFGFAQAAAAQWELGRRVRTLMAELKVPSVAADGFQAPGVVVSYTADPAWQNGSRFAAEGLQIAAGVPLALDEGPDFRTFRVGLFGLDKLKNVDRSVASLERVLRKLVAA